MSVHNHPPYRPVCNERDVDGQLRGACLNNDGTPRDNDAAQDWATVAFALARDLNRIKRVCEQEHPPKMGSPSADWPIGTETRHGDGACCVLLEDGDHAITSDPS